VWRNGTAFTWFESRLVPLHVTALGIFLASCSHACASVTKQYNLVPAYGRWHSLAEKVTACLVESNGYLLLGGWLKVTCGLTACTPGLAPSQRSVTSSGKLYLLHGRDQHTDRYRLFYIKTCIANNSPHLAVVLAMSTSNTPHFYPTEYRDVNKETYFHIPEDLGRAAAAAGRRCSVLHHPSTDSACYQRCACMPTCTLSPPLSSARGKLLDTLTSELFKKIQHSVWHNK